MNRLSISLFLSLLLFHSLAIPAPTLIEMSINPSGTYLFVDDDPPEQEPPIPADSSQNASSFRVSNLGIKFPYNELIGIRIRGGYSYREDIPDASTATAAVFSGLGGFLVPPDLPDSTTLRGQPVNPALLTEPEFTIPSHFRGISTDIAQDFRLHENFTYTPIPPLATSILFTPNDSFFSDNTDANGDYRAQIITFKTALEGGVVEVFDGGDSISANFAPKFSLTLDEAALLGGFDHFNWYQRVERRTVFGVPDPTFVPFTDPRPGGNPNQKFSCNGVGADSKPFYYDDPSAANPGCSEASEGVDKRMQSNKLLFDDAPDLIIPTTRQFFSTFLVGVRSDGTWVVFDEIEGVNFRWSYTQLLAGGDVDVFSGLEAESDAGVTEMLGFLTFDDFDADLYKAIARDGGSLYSGRRLDNGTISEPSSITLLLLAFLCAAAICARHRANPRCGG